MTFQKTNRRSVTSNELKEIHCPQLVKFKNRNLLVILIMLLIDHLSVIAT